VALVADIDDLVPLPRTDPDLVVDLGDQRTHRIDDIAARCDGGLHHLGGRAVGRQHDRGTRGHLGDVVHEDHASCPEPVDHPLVVDDLVIAVHRRFEGPHHPGECLDGHLDTRAEPAG
jgi:hypothetical protein